MPTKTRLNLTFLYITLLLFSKGASGRPRRWHWGHSFIWGHNTYGPYPYQRKLRRLIRYKWDKDPTKLYRAPNGLPYRFNPVSERFEPMAIRGAAVTTKFAEPGGSPTFGFELFSSTTNTPTIVSDFVHVQPRSIKTAGGASGQLWQKNGILQDAGFRISKYLYVNAYASSSQRWLVVNTGAADVIRIRMSSAGVMTVADANSVVLATGSTWASATWIQFSLVVTVTSTTVNRIDMYKNGVLDATVTNATLTTTGCDRIVVGNHGNNANQDFRHSDIYVDDDSSLAYPGDIRVTAKRPFANGTTNGFTLTGAGSGYGSGNAVGVNERAASDASYVSVVAASAVTEEYTIEGVSVGDENITNLTIVDYMGWVRAKALLSETASIIVDNVTSNISLTSTTAQFMAAAGKTTYPITGTDIGIITTSLATTVTLYECGIIIAHTMVSTAGGATPAVFPTAPVTRRSNPIRIDPNIGALAASFPQNLAAFPQARQRLGLPPVPSLPQVGMYAPLGVSAPFWAAPVRQLTARVQPPPQVGMYEPSASITMPQWPSPPNRYRVPLIMINQIFGPATSILERIGGLPIPGLQRFVERFGRSIEAYPRENNDGLGRNVESYPRKVDRFD